MFFRLFGFVTAALAVTAICGGVSALDLEPRAYVNTPVGLNFLIAGYGHAAGGMAFDPSVPLENAHVRTNVSVFAYARALDVLGKSGKVDVIVPYAWVSGAADFQGQTRERNVSGFGAPRFRFQVNFYGRTGVSTRTGSDFDGLGIAWQYRWGGGL